MRSGSFVHTIAVAVADSSVPDGELLARFAESGDAAAFELLVFRYAELVWRVCRSELPADRHAAEDAFQTTFLVLARKAGSVREVSAAGYLFRVARNAAVRVRKRIGRIAEVVADVPAESTADPIEADECAAVIIEEVQRLPDKFRLPVLLCFFDDCSHSEAADRLGWAVGTVSSRLARAKDRLRDRLIRRGLVLPAALTSLAVPASLVRAAVVMATNPSGVPMGVSELTREVLNAMWNAKLKLIGGVALALLTGGIGVMTLTAGHVTEEAKATAKEEPRVDGKTEDSRAKEKPEDAELKKLQGMWRVTRLESKRGLAPAEEIEPMRWEIVGTTVFAQDNPADKEKQESQIFIDPTKSPKQITLTLLNGPQGEVGKELAGIYELKNDKLRICLVFPGKERPTEFKLNNADDGGIIELERIPAADPKNKQQPKARVLPIRDGALIEPVRNSAVITGLKDLAGEWRVLSAERDGVPAKGKPGLVDIHRDVAWFIEGENALKVIIDLDADKGLIGLDRIAESGTVEGKPVLGRFKWKDNKLTLILGEPGANRPDEANTGKNSTVMVMERVAK
jgi:RNA polymerase sigma factor (sigma-70 family)